MKIETVSATVGGTRNLGDYNSLKAEVHVSAALEPEEDPAAALDTLLELAQAKVRGVLTQKPAPAPAPASALAPALAIPLPPAPAPAPAPVPAAASIREELRRLCVEAAAVGKTGLAVHALRVASGFGKIDAIPEDALERTLTAVQAAIK